MKDETMPDATLKALSALDAMSELWATEANLRGMVRNISAMPRLKMLDAIEALVKQAFVEGAYRHHCDVKDGKVPYMTYNAGAHPRGAAASSGAPSCANGG